jgi:DNA polymerase-3 subunit alpha
MNSQRDAASALEPGFTHLKVHSHYTLLGGTAAVKELVDQAVADKMTHLALTDTNALYGAVAFDRFCQEAGIQPILGMTVTVIPPPGQGTSPGQLVLLATGPAGYQSLCRLSSLVQGSRERESLAARGLGWEALGAHSAGLLCLSGGRQGWVMRYLAQGDRPAARRTAARLAAIYGAENTYLSLELHRPTDRPLVEEVAALARRLGLPTVALQPVYCLSLQDVPRLRLLAAIDHNCRLDVVPADGLPDGGDPSVTLHWLHPGQVLERLAAFPEAMAATGEVASRCGPALPDGRPVWPAIQLPPGRTSDQELARLAQAGLAERYGADPAAAVRERLERELAAIARHGYAPLFLVVADAVRYAREQEIPVSTRGSVANSLVAYCTGITTVDPVAHDLLFERFLNPARSDPPDIDLDLCSRQRDRVLDYVRRTYGDDRVALVGAVNTMRPRSAVRETAKAYGLDEGRINALVAILPRGWHPDPRRRDRRSVDQLLAELADPQLQEIVRVAYSLVGQPHHLSVHAGGLTITPGPLSDWVPVQWAPKGFLITQYAYEDVERLGLIKIDLLGIRALTVLAETAALVRDYHDSGFRLSTIPLDDPLTQTMLARGETIGVFQCESTGAQRTLRQLQARTVRDLAVANAFFKPGPSTGGMARTFVRRYRGEEPVTFLHPALEPILSQTKGVLIFQEQILRVAREIAGLSWAQANQLRRGMSKFRPEEMADLQEQFVRGCQRPAPDGPGLTTGQAATLWEQVSAFAGYGFNQGHATAYADVSYRSAYLKRHWPAAFLCARLADWGGFHHPAIYMAEAVRLGIRVRPPHVNHSGPRFTLTWEAGGQRDEMAHLWMGLGQVRDLRRASVKAIVAGREGGPYTSLRDLLLRVPLQPKEVLHLIRCGALDGLGESRAALLDEAEQVQRAGSVYQLAFGFARTAVRPEEPAQRLVWERRLLGQPVSVHPLALVADRLPQYVPLAHLPETAGRLAVTAGVRLPGWTGGPGFFLGDEDSFLVVREREAARGPRPWEPLLVRGRWVRDEWGTEYLNAESIQPVGEAR